MARLCAAALLLAALAVNFRVLDFGFLYLRDDDINVALNPHMGGLSLDRLRWMFTDWGYVRRYMPLGWLNFSATYELAGLDAGAYHAVALGLYVLDCGLVFALVLHVLRLFGPAAAAGASRDGRRGRPRSPRAGGRCIPSASRRPPGSPGTSTARQWPSSSPP